MLKITFCYCNDVELFKNNEPSKNQYTKIDTIESHTF